MSTDENISAEDRYRGQRDYWRQVAESDGFDLEDISVPSYMYGNITGLIPVDCQSYYSYRVMVQRYAKLGLHRYNMLEGTRFELDSLIKFNFSPSHLASYYMTFLAHDQDPAGSTLQKTFQVRVDEKEFRCLDLGCSIARLKHEVTTRKPFVPHFHGGAVGDGIFKGELPDWPSDDDFHDGKRFYMVKESEWQATAWISMYLELVICANDRSIIRLPQQQSDEILSKLKIVKVAIETGIEDVEPSNENERLNAKSVNVYITYKGLTELQVFKHVFEIGEHVERKAIVRRVIDEHTGNLTLLGKLCGGQYAKPKWPPGVESPVKSPPGVESPVESPPGVESPVESPPGVESCKKRPRIG
ncbi:unnamed protein product [Thlaspi arvense]|uniref:Uncharacterized protein n=1 Tax=Thlaspi arvense TaxID=13288 RepID=A0AAU9R513_THLAR|nr:unnamed protein product [Thlaspi arvense]